MRGAALILVMMLVVLGTQLPNLPDSQPIEIQSYRIVYQDEQGNTLLPTQLSTACDGTTVVAHAKPIKGYTPRYNTLKGEVHLGQPLTLHFEYQEK